MSSPCYGGTIHIDVELDRLDLLVLYWTVVR